MKSRNSLGNTIGDLIIATLLNGNNIKRFNSIIKERELSRFKEESVRSVFSRLNKKDYINKTENGWMVTAKGKEYSNRVILLSYLPSPFNSKSTTNTIISFDIPGPQRNVRDWLRNQIKIYNYKMIHQSLWLGPGPLPKEFLDRIKKLKIRENIKIFNIDKK